MIGPRSMGAGTQRYGDAGTGGVGPTRQQRTRTYEHPYRPTQSDVDMDIPPDRETKAKVALTPAQRLIERYERMSTPPLSSPSSSHSHRIPPGAGTVRGSTTTMMRAKSTRSRQYVYDYRTASAPALDDGDDDNGNSNKRGGGGGVLKKDRSPIRQSLKNLFSVLKKGAGGLTKLAHHHGHHGKGVGDESALLGVPGRGGGVHPNEIPSKDKTNVKWDDRNPKDGVQQQQQQSQALPRKKMAGPLLYLSRQMPLCDADSSSDSEEDVQGHPKPACNTAPKSGFTGNEELQAEPSSWAWSTCSVTLEEGKLVVSCFTGDLELYVREIALTRCVDIRSLSTAQLEAAVKEEGILVEKSDEDKDRDKEGKIFEMTFSDGRPKERFAAKSVRERAGWISAIWDAILPSRDIDAQQPEGASSGERQDRDRTLGHPMQENIDSRKLPVESPTPTPLPKMSSLLLDRSQYSSSPPPPSLPSKDPSTPPRKHIQTDAASVPLTMPTVLPLVPHKKPPDLHLDLSEFAGPMSPPSIYPPTIISPSTGASRSQNEVVISPSIYGQTPQPHHNHQQGPPSSRPASIFVASPISCLSPASALSAAGSTGPPPPPPPPHSPSIRNLSQLSVVRQRLAQIQRNHSELSGDSRSRYSYVATTPGGAGGSPTSSAHLRARARSGLTPLESPISPIGSGWSRSEAVFYGGKGKGKEKARGRDDDLDADLISPRFRKKDGGQRTIFHDEEEEERQDESESPNPKTKARARANSHSRQDHRPASVISPSVSPGKQKHTTTTTHTCNYTGPSKDDFQRLSKEVNSIKNVLGGESGCSTVHEMVFNLEQRMRGSGDDNKATREKDKRDSADLRAIKDELKVLGNRVSEVIATNVDVAARIEVVNESAKAVFDANANANAATAAAASAMRPPTTPTSEMSRKDDQAIIQALNEVKDRLSVEFPALAGKLQDIKDAQHKEVERQKEKEKEIAREKEKESKVVTLNNVARSSSVPPRSGDDSKATEEYKVLLEKMEEIRAFCQAPNPALNAPPPPVADTDKDGNVDLKENLNKIISLIQEDSNKQTLLSQQQGDSVRYLNELNSWLEAFVNNGTSQIQGISNNIERLCNEIGCTSTNSSNGRSRSPQAQPNLVNDIRQLVAGMKARDQNFTALQAAVHSLLDVLTASQAQHGADSQAIAGLMDRQRHDQEAMFRAFTNEISGEIKGERLRFVDAMKEATAINVQLHVEQFKQELNKEVMAMTEEVGRLHREKQIVENQISDLFSFYSKHKKAEMPLQVIPPNTGVPVRNSVQEAPRANIPRSNRQRALPPYPRYDQQ